LNTLKKRIVRSSSANGLGLLARLANQLLIVPILILGWSAELYGEWLLISTIPTFLALSDFGFIAAGSNELAKRASQGTREETQSFYDLYSVSFQRWSFMLALVITICSFLIPFTQLMGLKLISPVESAQIFILLSISAIIAQNSLSLLAGLRVQGKFHIGLLTRALFALTQILFTWLLVSFFNASPVILAMSMLFFSIIQYVTEWFILKNSGLYQKANPFIWRYKGSETMRPYLLMGLELMLMPLAQALVLQGSIILIGKFLGPIAVAVYATHRTLARTSASLLQIFTVPLRAEAGMLQKEDDKPLLTEVTSSLSRITLWLSLITSFGLILLGSWIFSIWTQEKLIYNPELFIILLIAVIFESLWRVPTSIRLGSNRHKPVAWGYFFLSLIGLLLATYLSIDYGVEGVALGLCLVDFMMAGLAIWTLRGILDITVQNFIFSLIKPPIKELKNIIQRILSLRSLR
jgi:O-antigen/teichoic acid export membrane protein